MREIGSEFSKISSDNCEGLQAILEGYSVFSGRTAIETVLKELPLAKKALLPSYCCESMIVPFRKIGIAVDFYNVYYDNGMHFNINITDDVDIFVWCNYFGFRNEMPDLTSFKERGGIVIEDITHSYLSEKQYHEQADYLVASIRKWEPIYCGGYCASMNGILHHLPCTKPSKEFIANRRTAMQLKSVYLCNHDESLKIEFLRLFRESNSWLAENYSGLLIDSCSKQYLTTVDIDGQKRIRRNNATVLYEGLKNKVQFIFSITDMDCPLFVPILLPQIRDDIRKYLTSNSIYCPIHWPKPQGCESNLYNMELSLICDQRYSAEDMERIVAVLNDVI